LTPSAHCGPIPNGRACSLTAGFCGVVAGIIDSRSSVHRPPNSAKGVYTGAIQHDLELLAVYKQLGREEDRALASYTSPYQFEDDAVDGEVSASKGDSHPLDGLVLNLEGFEDWVRSMHAAIEQRNRRKR